MLSLSLALACAAKPGTEPAPTEPEPVVFVEAVPDPAQPKAGSQPASRIDEPSADDQARAKELFMEGMVAYESGDYVNALTYFDEAHVLAPLPALMFNIARCHEALGHAIAACHAYRLIDLDPNTDQSTRQAAAERETKLGC